MDGAAPAALISRRLMPSSASDLCIPPPSGVQCPSGPARPGMIFNEPGWLKPFADDDRQVGEPAGVAPFVVVPAEYLGEAAGGLGQAGVEDARGGIADDVGGDQRVGAVAQDDGH